MEEFPDDLLGCFDGDVVLRKRQLHHQGSEEGDSGGAGGDGSSSTEAAAAGAILLPPPSPSSSETADEGGAGGDAAPSLEILISNMLSDIDEKYPALAAETTAPGSPSTAEGGIAISGGGNSNVSSSQGGAGSGAGSPSSSSSSSPERFRTVVTEGLRSIQEQHVRAVKQWQEEKRLLLGQLGQAERQLELHRRERTISRDEADRQVEEVRERYQVEIELLQWNFGAEIVAAAEQASQQTERCRKYEERCRSQLRSAQSDQDARIASAAEQARQQAESEYRSELDDLRSRHEAATAELQGKYDALETELLQALDDVDELEAFQDETLPQLQVEVTDLRRQLDKSSELERTLLDTVKALQDENALIQGRFDSSQLQVSRLEGALADKTNAESEARAEIDSLRKQLEEESKQRAKVQAEVASAQSKPAPASAAKTKAEQDEADRLLASLLSPVSDDGGIIGREVVVTKMPAKEAKPTSSPKPSSSSARHFPRSPHSAFDPPVAIASTPNVARRVGTASKPDGKHSSRSCGVVPRSGRKVPSASSARKNSSAADNNIRGATATPARGAAANAASQQRSGLAPPASASRSVRRSNLSGPGRPSMLSTTTNLPSSRRQSHLARPKEDQVQPQTGKKASTSSLKPPSTSSKLPIGRGGKPRSLLSKYGQPNATATSKLAKPHQRSNVPSSAVRGRGTKDAASNGRRQSLAVAPAAKKNAAATGRQPIGGGILTVQTKGLAEAGGSKKAGKNDSTSPKILIQNVLKALSPEHHEASTAPDSPQAIPSREAIEPAPREDCVGSKFESLAADWSTRKEPRTATKRGYNDNNTSATPLSFKWSTTTKKKTLRDEERESRMCFSNKRLKRGGVALQSPSSMSIATTPPAIRAAAALSATPGSHYPHFTPPSSVATASKMVQGHLERELNELFSPEEPLLSPSPVSAKTTTATKLEPANSPPTQDEPALSSPGHGKGNVSGIRQNAAITLQAHARRLGCNRNFHKSKKSVVAIQTHARAFLARKRYVKIRDARRDAAAIEIQRTVRATRCRTVFARRVREARREAAAALLVQRTWRGNKTRTGYRLRRQSVTRIQCFARGALARNIFKRRGWATVKLQSHIRTVIAVRQFRETHRSVVFLQALVRRHRAFTLASRKRSAILAIQGLARSGLERKRRARLQQDRAANAAIIQKAWRDAKARAEYQHEEHMSKAAATLVQRVWRGRCYRAHYRHRRYAAVLIQTVARRSACQRRFDKSRRNAIVVQSLIRRYQGRQAIQSKRNAAIGIQVRVRSYLERKKLRKQQFAAATEVQKVWRGSRLRSQFQRKKKSLLLIQRVVRGYVDRSEFQRLIEAKEEMDRFETAAATIASFLRAATLRKTQRMQYASLRIAAVNIQRHSRCYLARRTLTMLRRESAVLQIQKYARGLLQRKEYASIRLAVVSIQCQYRSYAARHELVELRGEMQLLGSSATKIETFYRSVAARGKFRHYRRSAIFIQSLFRRYLAQRHMTELQEMADRAKSAVVLIQKLYRGKQQRITYEAVRHAARTIQRYCRGYLGRRAIKALRLERDRDEAAAVSIQKMIRGSLQRTEFEACCVATILIQSFARGILGRGKARGLHEERSSELAAAAAAVTIQKAWRGKLIFVQYKSKHHAVVAIQSFTRITHARRKLTVLRQERDCRDAAATTIQTIYRGKLHHSTYKSLHRAAVTIQSFVRTIHAASKLSELRQERECGEAAATTIQKIYRGKLHRTTYRSLYSATVTIQSFVRIIHARCKLLELRQESECHEAAMAIQKIYRGKLHRTAYRSLHRATVTIQSFARGNSARGLARDQRKVLAAADNIQKGWKAHRAMKSFKNQRLAALKLQSYGRRLACQQRFRRLKHSAVLLQTCFRRVIARKTAVRRRLAVFVIQDFARTVLEEISLSREEAATLVQKVWRGWMHRFEYCRQRKASIVLECFARVAIARQQLGSLKHRHAASTKIQALVRARMAVAELRSRRASAFLSIQTSASICIQKYFRRSTDRNRYLSVLGSIIAFQAVARGHRIRALLSRTKAASEKKDAAEAVAKEEVPSTAQKPRRKPRESISVCPPSTARKPRESINACLPSTARKPLGTISACPPSTARKPRESISACPPTTTRKPLGSISACPPTTTRKSTRKPLGSVAPPSTTRSKSNRKPLGSIGGAGPADLLSPVKTRRTRRTLQAADGENRANSKPKITLRPKASDVEQLKVVQLRQLLTETVGLEKKEVRGLRKAELVSLVVQKAEVDDVATLLAA